MSAVANGREVLLNVPKEFAQFPLGFALDAGGSVVKLVYRSKLDYTAGQPNDGEDVLRLRFFPNGKGDELIEFLKDNCDSRLTSQDDISAADHLPLYYQTGVNTQNFVTKLAAAFRCRIETMSEATALYDGVLRVRQLIPQLQKTIPYSVESTSNALTIGREFIKMFQGFKEAGVDGFGEPPNPVNEADVLAYMMKMMTIDPSSMADELNAKPITFPCVLVQCGSATASSIVYEDGKFEMGDFNPTAGKTVSALGRLLTGAQNFEELVQMASRGDKRKVDLLTGDLKNKESKEVNFYSLMPDSFPVFTLGKAAEERYDGTYSKEDLAAAIISMQCRELAHFGISVAVKRRVNSVIYSGSFANWPLTQQLMQECFLSETFFFPIVGDTVPAIHILSNSGFLTALGTWHHNIQAAEKTQ